MNFEAETEQALRNYLLGVAPDAEQERIEMRLLREDDFAEQLLIAEEDLIDDYLGRTLSENEQVLFETHFLTTPQRREKLTMARVFHRHLREANQQAENTPETKPETKAAVVEFPQRTSQPALPVPPVSAPEPAPPHPAIRQPIHLPVWARIAAGLVLAGALGIIGWRSFRTSKPDEIIARLNQQYVQRRAVSRISGFEYAPTHENIVSQTTRGSENKSTEDATELQLRLLIRQKPDAAAYHLLGRLYLIRRDFDKATANLDKAVALAGNNAEKALILSDLGAAYLDQAGKVNVALLAQANEKLSEALALNPALREALFNRAIVSELQLLNRTETDWEAYLSVDSASSWAQEARDRLERFRKDKKQRSDFRIKAADNFQAALIAHDDTEAWHILSGNRERTKHLVTETLITDYLQLTAENRIAEARQKLEFLTKAGELEKKHTRDEYTFRVAAFYRTATPAQFDQAREAWALLRQGRDKFDRSEYSTAITLFEQAEKKFQKADNEPEMLFARLLKGHSQLRKQDLKDVLPVFKLLERESKSRKYYWLQEHSLNSLGDIYSTSSDEHLSRQYLKQSIQIADEIKDPAGKIRNLVGFLTWAVWKNDEKEALQRASEILRIYIENPVSNRQSWGLYSKTGEMFLHQGNFHSASNYLQQSLSLAESDPYPHQISFSRHALATLCKTQGNYLEALHHLEKATAVIEKIPGKENHISQLSFVFLDQADVRQKLGRHSEALKFYQQALEQFSQTDTLYESYLCRKGKLRSLIQERRYKEAEADLQSGLQDLENHRQKIIDETSEVSFFDLEHDFYELSAEYEWQRGNSDEAFRLIEASRSRSLLEKLHSQPLNAIEIQQQLPDERLHIVEYAVLPQRLLIWDISKKSIEKFEVPETEVALTEKIEKFLALISHHPSEDSASENYRPLAMELYQLLLGKVCRQDTQQRLLCIIPDKKLDELPFDALMPQPDRYLIDDYMLTRAPSASLFIHLLKASRNRKPSGQEKMLVVGNPRFDQEKFADLPYLPEAAEEAQQIARSYSDAILLTGDAATEKQMRQNARQAHVIHLSTHATADPDAASQSVLLLTPGKEAIAISADDGMFNAQEISQIKMPRARLVVLGACSTAVGRNYRGEGTLHLARSFMAQGVPLIVASLWPVNSAGSADLMVRFHRHRAEGHLPESEALRKAQQELRNNPDFRHPYFWAAFTSIGAPNNNSGRF